MFSRHGIAQNSSFVLARSAERKHSDLFDLNRFVRFLSVGHSFWSRSVEWEIQQICSNIFCYFSAHLTRLYIKPQRRWTIPESRASVSIGGYTSNHNGGRGSKADYSSVSIGGYTSNHNWEEGRFVTQDSVFYWRLYIKPQRLSWSNAHRLKCFYWRLYIKPQLPQLLDVRAFECFYWRLYIKPQLWGGAPWWPLECFYWRLYIKPQLIRCLFQFLD